ncbi:hypothetical protein [Roseibium aestuarii]|uniref:PH (Pleckstrin Homology) domain-containing protein n=1 Tax=Roseibium aestuarii TaxID=2600299 RepID=A0ABW4JYY0_9HYPH|nr:hypothetical protein [Roseibium aestuarii]
MGRTARLELLRRLLPLGLAVLGLSGAMTFLSLLTGGMCLAAAAAIYFALPHPRLMAGAVRPTAVPPVGISDAIGFLIGVPLLTAGLVGAGAADPAMALVYLALLLPGSLCIPLFILIVRQETSWIRFVNNGFEITQMGLTARVPYSEIRDVELKSLRASGGRGWMMSLFAGGGGHKRITLLNAGSETKAMIFRARNGDVFSVSCEVIPDLNRVLVGLDRAGVDLPAAFAERQRKRTRKMKERIYGKPELSDSAGRMEKLDSSRIAETIRRYRQRKLASG